jgi:hypothetical protein
MNMPLDRGLLVPWFELRSLTTVIPFHTLLIRAVNDRTLVWSDCIKTKGRIRELLWMIFAGAPQTIDEWKACLISPSPKSAPSIVWLFWAAEQVFLNTARNTPSLALKDLIEAYKESCPRGCGLGPIALLSVGLRLRSDGSYGQQQSNDEGIAKILKNLPNSDDGAVISEWLLGTRKWTPAVPGPTLEEGGDLLVSFLEEVEKLVEQGTLERDTTYERAINCVKALQERREALQFSRACYALSF